jgi:Fuc2NAc and GlcNAc transferase
MRVPADALIAVPAAFVISWLLTAGIRKVALARGVLDVPGARSSHSRPTPRGGGVAIVITVLTAVEILAARGVIERSLASVLLFGGFIVGLVGLADDIRSVSVALRLSVQFAAFIWCVWRLGPLPPVHFGVAVIDLGIAGSALAVICMVWFLNLYNFMDGIDGIAGIEAVSVMAFAAALLAWPQGGSRSVIFLLVASASVLGFLVWNWPPAKIFMGDSGSGFLGFCVGSIAWATIVEGRLSIWVWLILLGVFCVDATVTLLRRWMGGARIAQAHRSHAYQRLSRKYGSHQKVTLGILGVNLVWLDPLAYVAAERPPLAALLTSVAWLPLIIAAWRCGAGVEETAGA